MGAFIFWMVVAIFLGKKIGKFIGGEINVGNYQAYDRAAKNIARKYDKSNPLNPFPTVLSNTKEEMAAYNKEMDALRNRYGIGKQ
jgi:hypothetical protein